MNPDKDYYAILGVIPGAEDIVIRAAYKALAQRYHPDRFHGLQEDAHARMSELNEAYGVLSDELKRKSYDQRRGAKMDPGGGEFGDAEERPPPGDDPLENDWRIALKYYPDLAALERRLSRFSWKLANTYRAYLLETQQFEPRELLAGLMENHFLKVYFGDDKKAVDFARRLIGAKQRNAALALNEAIRVLGNSVEMTGVIAQIGRDFGIRHLTVDKERICSLLAQARGASAHLYLFTHLLNELGGTCAFNERARNSEGATADTTCRVEFDGRNFQFSSEGEFRSWLKKEILPIAEQLAQ